MNKRKNEKGLNKIWYSWLPWSTTQKLNFVKSQTPLLLNLSVTKCFDESFVKRAHISGQNFKPFESFCLESDRNTPSL